MKQALFLLGSCLALALCADTQGFHRFTTPDGDEVEARVVSEQDGRVTLETAKGRRFTVRRSALSREDRDWLDGDTEAGEAVRESYVFDEVPMSETRQIDSFCRIRRFMLESFARLRNNDSEKDRMSQMLAGQGCGKTAYGWAGMQPEFYEKPGGGRGKLKSFRFAAPEPLPLRIAVQMAREKFRLSFPRKITAVRKTFEGCDGFELMDAPAFVERAFLEVEHYSGTNSTVRAFRFTFPPGTRK